MSNHYSDLVADLRRVADLIEKPGRLFESDVDAIRALRQAADLLDARPCQHSPVMGYFEDQSRGAGCQHCGVPMERVWVVSERPES